MIQCFPGRGGDSVACDQALHSSRPPLPPAHLLASCIASARLLPVMSKDEASEQTPSTLCASSKMMTAFSQLTCGGRGGEGKGRGVSRRPCYPG